MRILLLDTGFSSLPIYEFLIEAGHDVFVMGNRETDIIARHAGDKWIAQDYSQIDAVKKIIDELQFDRIVPGCTDLSMDSCIKVNSDSPYRDNLLTNDLINNKDLFRELCSKLDLPAPKTLQRQEFPLSGRYICKPVDAFSGLGVTIFDGSDLDALELACRCASDASRTKGFIIEEFVEGDLYSCTGFLENDVLTDVFFVREGMSNNPFAVDTSFVVEQIDETSSKCLIAGLNKLSAYLGMKDGLLHTQFILSANGPKIIEATRRCPGDLYAMLVEYSTGFRYAAKYASYHLGVAYEAKVLTKKHIVRHTVTADHNGIFDGLRLKNGGKNVYNFFPLVTIGEVLYPSPKCRVGVIFCELDTPSKLDSCFHDFMTRNAYQLTKTV